MDCIGISETELWRRFRDGDSEAFSRIYELYADEMFRYGMKIAPGKDVVLDSIHDVFVKIFGSRKFGAEISRPKAYLFKSLRGQIYDNLRKDSRLPSVEIDSLPFNVEWRLSEAAGNEIADREEIEAKYRRVVAMMTDRQKEAVYLHYSMGFSYEEAAELMGMNVQSLRNLMFRAVSKIRKVMPLALFLQFLI